MSGPTWGLRIQGYSSPSAAQERAYKKLYPAEWAAHQDDLARRESDERFEREMKMAKSKAAKSTAPYNEQVKPILEALARGETIQYQSSGKWVDFTWDQVMEALRLRHTGLRVKPNVLVITIGDVTNEVPGPYRGEMKAGQTFYVPSPATSVRFIGETWNDDSWDFDMQNAGLVHLSQQDAILHARALRGEKL